MALLEEKMLGQARPALTTAGTVYTFPGGVKKSAIIKGMIVCNTTNTKVKFSIFIDQAGSTYDESTALHFEQELNGKSTFTKEVFAAIGTAGGTIGVQTDAANALTFTFFGAETENDA